MPSDFVIDFVIGLGSNLGVREAHLCEGAAQIGALTGVEVVGLSRVFETDALGPPQPRYLNAAVSLRSQWSAAELLDRLLAIEQAHGRVRTLRWGPRTLDLDILWSSVVTKTERLSVPHAQLCERNFALAPLLELVPELSSQYAEALRVLGGAPTCVGRLCTANDDKGASVVFERSDRAPV